MFPLIIDKINIYKDNKEQLISNGKIEINEGDFIHIVGNNHAGKTTLLNLINANPLGKLSVVAKYEIGNDGSRLDNIEKYKKCISYIEQSDEFYFSNPYEELCFEFIKHGNNVNKTEIDDLLQQFNLSHFKNKNKKMTIEMLSGGEKRKLSIIKGLLKKDVKLLMIDEPFNNLDINSIIQVVGLLYRLNKKSNVTIIATSHFPLFVGVNKIISIIDKKIETKHYQDSKISLCWYIEDDELKIKRY
jgi:ABC-type multidrug transport system ATPase subunit